eukprot:TRINITY_DN5079_c0_g2_i1.p2 TRINITY_DN5079_c0_g2~~TRINITY_DN5079_c0_g2_i1.p2  ORF type:complete len:336 (-),score=107.57 TRINITY_DN5079_c0_g2_i1:74-1015(-)
MAIEEDVAVEQEHDDDDDALLGDLWDAFAKAWEKEFERQEEQEDSYIARRVEKADLLTEEKNARLANNMESKMHELDAQARFRSEFVAAVEDSRLVNEVENMKLGAEQGRACAAADAMREADDMLSMISGNAAERRRQREKKRLEEKRAQDAAFDAKWKAKQAEAAAAAAAGVAGNGYEATGEAGERPKAEKVPPPKVRGEARPQDYIATPLRSTDSYDAAWSRFEKLASAAAAKLCMADVPWPLALPTVSGIVSADPPKERKNKWRAAVLRWHPDKWTPILDRMVESDKAKVIEKVKEVTRRILDEKTRFLR